MSHCRCCASRWRHQMKSFSRYRPFVRGIYRSPIRLTKARDAELWCFLWCVSEQTVKQTVEIEVICDATALIVTSLLVTVIGYKMNKSLNKLYWKCHSLPQRKRNDLIIVRHIYWVGPYVHKRNIRNTVAISCIWIMVIKREYIWWIISKRVDKPTRRRRNAHNERRKYTIWSRLSSMIYDSYEVSRRNQTC